MPAPSERVEFMPPAPTGTARALTLALLAHLFLLGALTWGVNWQHKASSESFDAELWSALPQLAAPRAQEVPTPQPAHQPTPEKAPTPPPKTPDIAIEQPKSSPQVRPRQPQPEQAKPEPERRDRQREANLARMAGLASATGATNATGSAAQSSGPISAGYGGRIKARVRPNIAFTGDASGNPRVEIELRIGPDGTILGRPRVLKSSGNREWDDAVVRGFEKTEVLPRNEGGLTPATLVIGWRPSD